jgi:hypothetical protein
MSQPWLQQRLLHHHILYCVLVARLALAKIPGVLSPSYLSFLDRSMLNGTFLPLAHIFLVFRLFLDDIDDLMSSNQPDVAGVIKI